MTGGVQDEGDAMAAVVELCAGFPEVLRERLAAVPLVVSRAVPEHHRRRGMAADLEGAFLKPDGALEAIEDDPGMIALYLDNIRPLDAEHVCLTYLHEAAHALGMDELEVTMLGLDPPGAHATEATP